MAGDEQFGRSTPPRPTKKVRRTGAETLVGRKRAYTACQFCRIRKTKCDNVKPVCGVCRHHQATCKYTEDDSGHSFEPVDKAGQDILASLEEIKSILRVDIIPRVTAPSNQELVPGNHGGTRRPDAGVLRSADPTIVQHEPGIELGPSSKQLQCLNTRCETVLHWPIIQQLLPMDVSGVDYFLFDRPRVDQETLVLGSPSIHVNSQSQLSPIKSHFSATIVGLQEDQFLSLCQKFLTYVHARNPILDPAQLLRYAAQVAEGGLNWDAPSCLVLLSCALACYTEPWRPVNTAPLMSVVTKIRDVSATARAQGDAYYTAASKRLSLLGASIIDIQCFFFASILEKILMQPIRAWFNIQQACQRLQVLLRKKDYHQLLDHGNGTQSQHSSRHLEQRLFWSCYKSEQELMTEIGLQPSGMDKLDYSHLLPDPPAPSVISPQTSPSIIPGTDSFSNPTFQGSPVHLEAVDQEQSWTFYLTEISMRRTMVQTLQTLYEGNPRDWLANPEQVLLHIDSILQQISVWYQHLPPVVRFSEDPNTSEDAVDELTSYTRGRFMEWREACLRPALYLILHQYHQHLDDDDSSPSRRRTDSDNFATNTRLHHHAQSCLDLCAAAIRISSGPLRHGGTWFILRSTFRSAMQLVASAHYNRTLHLRNLGVSSHSNGIPQPHQSSPQSSQPLEWELKLPVDQAELYAVSLGMLNRWSSEASDVKVMERVLEAAIMTL